MAKKMVMVRQGTAMYQLGPLAPRGRGLWAACLGNPTISPEKARKGAA